LILLVLGGLGGPVRAADFSLHPTVLAMPEAGTITCLLLRAPAGQFRFVPPAGWQMRVQAAEQQVQFFSPDYGAFIALQFLSRPGRSELLGEPAREFVLSEHPRARVLEQFPAHTGCGSGVGFDLQWEETKGFALRARLALIPLTQGCIRFTLQANTNAWQRHLQPFGALLTSFVAAGAGP
jgi:hypothetical protein